MQVDAKLFREYKKLRYDESFSMMPTRAEQAFCMLKGREEESYKMAIDLDWECHRAQHTAVHETEDGYRIEFSAKDDYLAEVDWDLGPDPVEELIPHYLGHVSKSVARDYAEHLHEAQDRFKEKMLSGSHYFPVVFTAEVYDPDGILIGEDTISGCYVEWVGDKDTAYSVSDHVGAEAISIIEKDREARDFEARYMVS